MILFGIGLTFDGPDAPGWLVVYLIVLFVAALVHCVIRLNAKDDEAARLEASDLARAQRRLDQRPTVDVKVTPGGDVHIHVATGSVATTPRVYINVDERAAYGTRTFVADEPSSVAEGDTRVWTGGGVRHSGHAALPRSSS